MGLCLNCPQSTNPTQDEVREYAEEQPPGPQADVAVQLKSTASAGLPPEEDVQEENRSVFSSEALPRCLGDDQHPDPVAEHEYEDIAAETGLQRERRPSLGSNGQPGSKRPSFRSNGSPGPSTSAGGPDSPISPGSFRSSWPTDWSETLLGDMMKRNMIDINYELGEKLGQGRHSAVYKAKCKKTGRVLALKHSCVQHDQPRHVEQELLDLGSHGHPHILRLHDYIVDDGFCVNVMELCTGGDLRSYAMHMIQKFKRRDSSYCSGLPHALAARLIYQMLTGLVFLHERGILHRDIKPENYLRANQTNNAPVLLADFSVACHVTAADKLTKVVGTVHYVSPDVLSKSYNQKADVWSLGVTCFGLCTNSLPFNGVDREFEYVANIKKGNLVECGHAWQPHPSHVRVLVMRMLVHSADQRPTANALLQQNTWLEAFGETRQAPCCPIN